VDVRDVAMLHVAVVKFLEVQNERVFGFYRPYNWNMILDALRDTRPEYKFPAWLPDLGDDLTKVTTARAEELLVKMGRPGWVNLKVTSEDALQRLWILIRSKCQCQVVFEDHLSNFYYNVAFMEFNVLIEGSTFSVCIETAQIWSLLLQLELEMMP
jgi:hypothetical protein